MSSTNFNTPPLKLTLLAVSAVVILHVLTAMALVMVTPPVPVVALPEVAPPIEIQLVAAPVEITESVPEVQKSSDVKDIKPKATPQIANKPKPVMKTTPPVKAPVKSATKNITADPEPKSRPKAQADKPKAAKNEPFKHEIERQESLSTARQNALAASNERKILAAEAEKAAQESHAKTMRDAQAEAVAKVDRAAQAAQEAKAAQEVARAKADAAARAKADEKAAAEMNNTPVNFTANNASWVSKPSFNFPERAKRGAKSGDTFTVVLLLRVNKQGGIDSVRVAQSSGNAMLDREAQRQVRSGKFKPFTKDNVPVVGNVTLPISYGVP